MGSGVALFAVLAFGIPPDGVTARPEAIPQLEALAARRGRHGWFQESIAIYRWLAAVEPASPRACAWQEAVVRLTLMGGNKRDVTAEIQLLADIDRWLTAAPGARAELKQACHQSLYDVLAGVVVDWNRTMTYGCTAFSWQHWPLLELMFLEFLADFPDDPQAPEMRRQLARLRQLRRR